MKSESMAKAHNAVVTILSDKASYNTSLNYAVCYCQYALEITDPREMKIQVLYILNNITYWRHPQAKDVRKTLKSFAGVK